MVEENKANQLVVFLRPKTNGRSWVGSSHRSIKISFARPKVSYVFVYRHARKIRDRVDARGMHANDISRAPQLNEISIFVRCSRFRKGEILR